MTECSKLWRDSTMRLTAAQKSDVRKERYAA